jgi:hypothetical protein
MSDTKWLLGLALVLSTACSPGSGAFGADGYEQALAKYRVDYVDRSAKKFLPDDWRLDNYSFDPQRSEWKEKTGDQYLALRLLDENGDGSISASEKHTENIFDLRFVNIRDNSVIWLKVHPLAFQDAGRDLDVILENYADGLEGTGLFEQSSLFGLKTDKVRHYTTFIVKKEPTALGPLPAIRGVIEIADVEKLRLDNKHRDAKAELLFAKVAYLQPLAHRNSTQWPTVQSTDTIVPILQAKRVGLLVIGYYDDASRFESHLPDLRALLKQVVIPASAVPEPSALPAPGTSAAPATALEASAPPKTDAAPATAPAPSELPGPLPSGSSESKHE